MQRNLCRALVLAALFGAGCASLPSPIGSVARHRAEVLEDVYPCRRAAQPIMVDGRLDEAGWAGAPLISFLRPGTLLPPHAPTAGRMLYDDHCLYVAFQATDEDVWATYTARDSRLWEEDVLEIFLKTHPALDPYYEFNFSPLGMVYDAFYAKRAAGGYTRWSKWNCAGLRVAASVQGTVGDWKDRDRGWTVEAAIPFADLPTLAGRAPRPGDVWQFNLARYDYSVYQPEGVEMTASGPLTLVAPVTKPNFHEYENWRKMRFE